MHVVVNFTKLKCALLFTNRFNWEFSTDLSLSLEKLFKAINNPSATQLHNVIFAYRTPYLKSWVPDWKTSHFFLHLSIVLGYFIFWILILLFLKSHPHLLFSMRKNLTHSTALLSIGMTFSKPQSYLFFSFSFF